jgi:alanine dehydrogenase
MKAGDSMKTLLLKKKDVSALITPDMVISAVEESYMAYSRGDTIQPPIVSVALPERNGEMDVKAGYSKTTSMISVKCASGFYDNRKTGTFPNSMSTLLLFDGTTGFPLCMMDAGTVTGWRTGAAGAVSARLLARKNAKTAAIIGTGDQARMQLLALTSVAEIESVFLWGRSRDQMLLYLEEMCDKVKCKITPADTPQSAVMNADIVITATPASEILIKRDWIRPGTHIIAVGADMEGKQELDSLLFKEAKIVVDHLEQCSLRGELQNPLRQGVIRREDIHCEIGQILLGKKNGRETDDEITIFDMTGMAIQDNVTALKIYESALDLELGTYYDFME